MSKSRNYVTAALTFSVALGTGFVMQNDDAIASRLGADDPVAGPGMLGVTPAIDLPQPPDEVTTSTAMLPLRTQGPDLSTPVDLSDVPQDVETPVFDLPLDTPEIEQTILIAAVEADAGIGLEGAAPLVAEKCQTTLTAIPQDTAMVRLDLFAPCQPDAAVTLHHQGMMAKTMTDADGTLQLSIPALNQNAFFIAVFDDGAGAVAQTQVPDLVMYDRAVVQWQGEADVQLHALEFGAEYGGPGHIWAATPTSTTTGGFLTRLGNADLPHPLMAEVYTFPSGLSSQDGAVALSVEAEVTGRNCGRDVMAQTIQVAPGAEPVAMDLSMTLPDCTAIGEFLVLKNMFEDLTLASK